MSVMLTDLQRERIKNARIEKHITQLELSRLSGINTRTIQDLESGRRNSFSESTILPICKALDLDFRELMSLKEAPPPALVEPAPTIAVDQPEEPAQPQLHRKRENSRLKRIIGVAGLCFVAIFLIKALIFPTGEAYERTDWIRPQDIGLFEIMGPQAAPKDNGLPFGINYITMKGLAKPDEAIPVIFKWCWDYRPYGRPEVYISAFTEWDPDREIRIFDGVISGVGNDIRQFEFKTPSKPGKYKIRFFYASAYAPMISYYGSPPADQIGSPSSAPCCVMEIEVLANR